MRSDTASSRLNIPGLPWAESPESVGLSAERLQRLGARLQHGVERREIPGAVALVARRGQLAWLESFGQLDVAQGRAMRPDGIFRIASMTKPLTSLAIMMLCEEQRLSLLDPVAQYLPEIGKMGVERFVRGPDGAGQVLREAVRTPMTLQDLLRHTSGLTYGREGTDNPLKKAYLDRQILNYEITSAQFITGLSQLSLTHQPGTTWEYGVSTDVLGRVVEVVSGLTLAEFFRTRITEPLRMPDTAFSAPPEHASRAAAPQAEGPTMQVPPMVPVTHAPVLHSGGGGLVSTISDYARLCMFWRNQGELDGVRLLSRTTVQWMTSNHLSDNIAMGEDMAGFGAQLPAPQVGQGFGLGFAVRTQAGLNQLPGSVGDFSWSGVYGTFFWIDPQEDLFAILMMQSLAQRIAYRTVMRQGVYQAIAD